MPTAYIETTIPSYYTSRPARDVVQISRQTATRRWWDKGCSGFELFTSQEVLDEAGRGDPGQASDRLAMLAEIPVLELNPEVEDLARRLIVAGLVPPGVASDAATSQRQAFTRWIFSSPGISSTSSTRSSGSVSGKKLLYPGMFCLYCARRRSF